MTITVEAVYEGGVFKPAKPVPLGEHTRIQVTIQQLAEIEPALAAVDRAYGLVQWTGDPEVLRRVAEDDEFGILESP